jgi:hypothetical protein
MAFDGCLFLFLFKFFVNFFIRSNYYDLGYHVDRIEDSSVITHFGSKLPPTRVNGRFLYLFS